MSAISGTQSSTERKNGYGISFCCLCVDGLRTKRTNGDRTYEYTYLGSQLTRMTVDGHDLYFTYDAAGTPLTVSCDGTLYYYITNIQGDVIAIIDTAGTQVTSYIYDAWGNILSATGTQATAIGRYNPLRYRGYVYDTETRLYYLQSRYYNPKVGRFINADGYVATGQGFVGNNMFAYCLNNPINFVDYSGNSSTPFLSDTFVGLTEKTPLMKQYKDTLSRDNIAVPDEVVSDQDAEPVWTTIGNALINNFELSVGVGLGLYGETTFWDAIDFSIGIYGNNGVLSIEDGTINYGQDLYVGFEFSFWVFNFGFNEYIYKQNGTEIYNQRSSGFYMDETLSIGTSGYLYGGLSFSIGFDIVQFCYDTWHLF